VSRIKELVSDTAVYGLSSVVARFLNYLLVPFYTGFFEPAAYGVISLIYAAIVFLNVIFTFGMESAYIRYATEREQSKNVFRTIQTALFLVGTVFAMLMLLGSGWLMGLMSLDGDGASIMYILLIGILWFDTLSIVPYAELRLLRKSFTYAGYRIINVIINLTLNIYLVAYLGWGIEAVLWSNVIASGVTAIGLWIYTRAQFAGRFDTVILKQALLFGLPYVPNGLGFAVNEVIDRFFLNSMSPEHIQQIYGIAYSPEDITGIYNACYKLAIFMLLSVQMFRMAWQPFFMKYSKSEDNKPLFADVFDWFNILSASIFMLVSLFVYEIVAINVPILNGTLIDSRYWEGLHIVPVLLLAYWFQGWFVVFSAGIFIKDQTAKLPVITLVGAAITLILNIILVPFMGMMGAAIATLVCYAVISIMLLRTAKKAMNIPYRVARALIIMLVCAFLVWIGTESGIEFVTDFKTRLILLLLGGVFVFFVGKPKTAPSN
jgi:O-antigen/teichoic acid export membrane protein